MELLIIIGAGGLGRELLSQARGDGAHDHDWTVIGFLDSRGQSMLGQDVDVPVIGDPATYVPRPRERFLAAIGDPVAKERLIAPLIEKGAKFIDLRTEVRFGERSTWSEGSVFGRGVFISADCHIGRHCYIDSSSTIGHDVVVGDYSHIGARSFVAGNVTIGKCVTIHPVSAISRGVTLGEGAVVGMGSVVLRDVPPYTTVLGNPARIVSRQKDAE